MYSKQNSSIPNLALSEPMSVSHEHPCQILNMQDKSTQKIFKEKIQNFMRENHYLGYDKSPIATIYIEVNKTIIAVCQFKKPTGANNVIKKYFDRSKLNLNQVQQGSYELTRLAIGRNQENMPFLLASDFVHQAINALQEYITATKKDPVKYILSYADWVAEKHIGEIYNKAKFMFVNVSFRKNTSYIEFDDNDKKFENFIEKYRYSLLEINKLEENTQKQLLSEYRTILTDKFNANNYICRMHSKYKMTLTNDMTWHEKKEALSKHYRNIFVPQPSVKSVFFYFIDESIRENLNEVYRNPEINFYLTKECFYAATRFLEKKMDDRKKELSDDEEKPNLGKILENEFKSKWLAIITNKKVHNLILQKSNQQISKSQMIKNVKKYLQDNYLELVKIDRMKTKMKNCIDKHSVVNDITTLNNFKTTTINDDKKTSAMALMALYESCSTSTGTANMEIQSGFGSQNILTSDKQHNAHIEQELVKIADAISITSIENTIIINCTQSGLGYRNQERALAPHVKKKLQDYIQSNCSHNVTNEPFATVIKLGGIKAAVIVKAITLILPDFSDIDTLIVSCPTTPENIYQQLKNMKNITKIVIETSYKVDNYQSSYGTLCPLNTVIAHLKAANHLETIVFTHTDAIVRTYVNKEFEGTSHEIFFEQPTLPHTSTSNRMRSHHKEIGPITLEEPCSTSTHTVNTEVQSGCSSQNILASDKQHNAPIEQEFVKIADAISITSIENTIIINCTQSGLGYRNQERALAPHVKKKLQDYIQSNCSHNVTNEPFATVIKLGGIKAAVIVKAITLILPDFSDINTLIVSCPTTPANIYQQLKNMKNIAKIVIETSYKGANYQSSYGTLCPLNTVIAHLKAANHLETIVFTHTDETVRTYINKEFEGTSHKIFFNSLPINQLPLVIEDEIPIAEIDLENQSQPIYEVTGKNNKRKDMDEINIEDTSSCSSPKKKIKLYENNNFNFFSSSRETAVDNEPSKITIFQNENTIN